MNRNILIILFAGLLGGEACAQHATALNAVLNDSLRTLQIEQKIEIRNTSRDTLREIYLTDWINAFSSTRTPLARRFFEDYDRKFHFSRQEKRGGTTIHKILGRSRMPLQWERPPEHPDLIRITPDQAVLPGETYTIYLDYLEKLPSEDFTRFGYSGRGKYQLRYWFITPGVYTREWEVYSHKNMDDLYAPRLDLKIRLQVPKNIAVISSLDMEKIVPADSSKAVYLYGKNRLDTELFLTREIIFEDIQVDNLHVLTNMDDEGLNPVVRSALVTRIVGFLQNRLGPYPHNKILSTREDYATSPVYGLHQLPKFVRPFPEGFNYDLKQLKTITRNYLDNTLLLNPRKEKWVVDAIQTYLMMEYIDQFYPNLKILGTLSEIFGIRWFHAADLDFNEQYPLLYLYMARQNLDQPLAVPQDSLLEFNKNLANPYKAGVGLDYLEHFLGDKAVENTLREFYSRYQNQSASAEDFVDILRKNADKDIEWFYNDFVLTNEKIDFKIRKVKEAGDSLEVIIRNRTGNAMPVPIYGLNDGNIVYQQWVEDITPTRSVKIPAAGIETVALNYEGIVPEINQRNNYESVKGFIDKPLQFRLLKDVEDPHYTQVFFMPEFQYNLYDGLSFGAKVYNETLLDKNFEFSVAPLYGMSSETVVGSASLLHRIFFNDENLYAIRYGISGSRFSYGYDLLYQRLTPFLSLSFRNSYLRNSSKESLSVRNVNVYRDEDPKQPLEVPDYSVFNVNYSYRNPGLVEHFAGSVDFQLAEQFSKASLTLEYKKLFKNDRQINLRFFGGAFIYNDLPRSDYFSFALDRPTDYLFDYNYYGRSETSGLFSQQIIMAEGGFKSTLQPQYANQWITTLNASTTIWKWIFAYGDLGLVKNQAKDPEILYDSGIRLSLIQNYFELYFPVYSSEGWEFGDGNYDEKIRFIATLDLRTLTGIFSREWF